MDVDVRGFDELLRGIAQLLRARHEQVGERVEALRFMCDLSGLRDCRVAG